MKRVVLAVASVLASIAVLPLLSAAGAPAGAGDHGKVPETNCCELPFSYSPTALNGPSRWGAISPCYETCRDGGEQSPVDLTGAVTTSGLPGLSFNYSRSATVQVVNNGSTIKATVPAGSRFSMGDVHYELKEFHFHAPSEHYLNGQPAALELHLVNQVGSGRTAAVGVFIVLDPQNPNRDNPELAKIWQHLEQYRRTPPTTVANINIQALLPATLSSFRYAGSLTTPPCSQGLQWSVLATPIRASQSQIDRFRALFAPHGNSRRAIGQPAQPLNGRKVLKDF